MASTAYAKGLRLSAAGRHLEAIQHYEQALGANPRDPAILFALGNTAATLGMPAPAEQFFRQVLAIDPARLEATVNLANLLRASGQFDAAMALLASSLARAPNSPELNLTMGSVLRETGNAAGAERHTRAALEARPDYAPALSNLADLLCDTGARQAARELYDRAIRAEPGNAQVRLNRAILNLLDGALKQGWRDYAARTAIPGKVPVADLKMKAWTGGDLRRTRLLVRSEQGVGDQILFASLIPDLAACAARDGGTIILECEPRLVPLFARSFPDIYVAPARITAANGVARADYGWLREAGGANAWTLMGTLPRYLRAGLDSFPAQHRFLIPDAAEVARWRASFGSGLGFGRAIGICWRSGRTGGHRSLQYAPLEAWGAFLRALPQDCLPVSVQYDATADEVARLEQISGRSITVPASIDQKNELDRATALCAALDGVVSAPTAVSWAAAGSGTPTWKVLYDTSWTALGQDHEPFAPACRLAMPGQAGDWQDAFAQVIAALT